MSVLGQFEESVSEVLELIWRKVARNLRPVQRKEPGLYVLWYRSLRQIKLNYQDFEEKGKPTSVWWIPTKILEHMWLDSHREHLLDLCSTRIETVPLAVLMFWRKECRIRCHGAVYSGETYAGIKTMPLTVLDAVQVKGDIRRPCASCNISQDLLLRCSGCQSVKFCNRVCQVKKWNSHKPICEKLKKTDRFNFSKILGTFFENVPLQNRIVPAEKYTILPLRRINDAETSAVANMEVSICYGSVPQWHHLVSSRIVWVVSGEADCANHPCQAFCHTIDFAVEVYSKNLREEMIQQAVETSHMTKRSHVVVLVFGSIEKMYTNCCETCHIFQSPDVPIGFLKFRLIILSPYGPFSKSFLVWIGQD